MKLTMKTLAGKTFTVEAEASDTVRARQPVFSD